LLELGISISLDELGIGFSLGLTHLPLIPVILAIGAQAFAAARLGMLLGARIAQRYREAAERVAGIVLIVLGLFLAGQRLLA
jgi:putative Mn2+ efflux pump MntP